VFVAVMRMSVVRVIVSSVTRFGRRVLAQKFLPAVLAAKVKGFALTFSVERRRFVPRHSTNGVFHHIVLKLNTHTGASCFTGATCDRASLIFFIYL
jgi:Ni/Fe-hydrogenase subunit HybB-like protein